MSKLSDRIVASEKLALIASLGQRLESLSVEDLEAHRGSILVLIPHLSAEDRVRALRLIEFLQNQINMKEGMGK